MRRCFLAHVAAAACVFLVPGSVRAGGLEYAGAGAEALGRGAAVTARADSPMVLAYNPAGLAELRGTQFLIDMNLALFSACVDPAGYYGWGLYLGGQDSRLRDSVTGASRTLHLRSSDPQNAREKYYATPLDTVCLRQNVVPIPQIAWTTRLSERLGIGAGLIFPAAQPGGHWGGDNGVIYGPDGTLRPAPTRYMLLRGNNLGVFPTIAAAYRLAHALRLGAAFEWGVVAANSSAMATSGGGTIPARDIVARVKAQDFFVPALTVSAHAVPIDALDLVLAFRFQDDVHAKGRLDTTTGLFDPALVPHTTRGLEITSLRQRMPWKLRAGIRFADRLAPRPRGTGRGEGDPSKSEPIHDALEDERWDIEFDAEYQRNSRNDKLVIEYAPDQRIEFVSAMSGHPMNGVAFPNADVPFTVIEKQWKDQISLRLGTTINLLPGLFGISAGVHYENRGVDPSFMQVDFWPLERVGVHGGVIVRIARSVDLVASYGHIFQETLIVAPPRNQPASTIWNCYIGMPEQDDRCAAPAGRIETISKSLGPMTSRVPPPPREAPSQGTPDGTAQLNQNLTQTAQSQPAFIVNSGRYRSHFDVLAVGVNVHF